MRRTGVEGLSDRCKFSMSRVIRRWLCVTRARIVAVANLDTILFALGQSYSVLPVRWPRQNRKTDGGFARAGVTSRPTVNGRSLPCEKKLTVGAMLSLLITKSSFPRSGTMTPCVSRTVPYTSTRRVVTLSIETGSCAHSSFPVAKNYRESSKETAPVLHETK